MFAHFTVNEANAMLPSIISRHRELVNLKNEITNIQTELGTDHKYVSSLKDQILKKQELNAAITSFYEALEEMEDSGVVVKSVDEGLIDFPSLRFGEEIWLCWKDGETEIKFWHAKDEGFNGRRPIEAYDLEKFR